MTKYMVSPQKFAVEFVSKMRDHPMILNPFKPSPRQAIALTNLLQMKLLKSGELTENDYILHAVITSYPEVQPIAQEVAEEILFGEKIQFLNKEKKDKIDENNISYDETTDNQVENDKDIDLWNYDETGGSYHITSNHKRQDSQKTQIHFRKEIFLYE